MSSLFVLDATTKTITAKLSGAATTTNPVFVSSWADDTGTALVEGSTDGILNGATGVTVVPAPSGTNKRVIKYITIQNDDTAAVTVSIQYDDNGTFRNIAVVTLQVNDTWTTDGTYDSNGNLKTVQSPFSGVILPVNGGTGIANNNSATVTSSGNFAYTRTLTGATNVTFPTSGTITALGNTVTGTGSIVLATSPTLITPTLGAALATSINGNIFTTGSSTYTGTAAATYTFPTATATIVGTAATQTLTNKRVTRRLTTVNAPGATPSTNSDNDDIANFTGLATAITSMTTNLTGTPVNGDLLEFRFTDNGTPAGITWGASFGSTTVTLPTTTVASTILRVLVEWNSVASLWQCIAVA